MRVCRYSPVKNILSEVKAPEVLDYEGELILGFDQSSTCTGLTIGTRDKQICEVYTFEREKRKNESHQAYYLAMSEWVKKMISNSVVVGFALEEYLNRAYVQSNKVTAQSRGAILNIYNEAYVKSPNGNGYVQLCKTAKKVEINNKAWKAELIPREYFQISVNDVDAYYRYVSTVLPPMAKLAADASASLCIYMYSLLFYFGTDSIKAIKSTIDYNHDLSIVCFPFRGFPTHDEEFSSLADSFNSSNINEKQQEYINRFRKNTLLHTLRYTSGVYETSEDFVRYGETIQSLTEEMLASTNQAKSLSEECEMFLKRFTEHGCSEFTFNPDFTVEQNARSFTNRDKRVYFTVMEKSLHYCYAIPQFNLTLKPDERILMACIGH